jgi:hypothetical protein
MKEIILHFMNDIKIKQFDLSSIWRDYSRVHIFVGEDSINKSKCIRNILFQQKSKFPVGKVFTDREQFYSEFIPDIVIGEWSESGIDKLVKRQEIVQREKIIKKQDP